MAENLAIAGRLSVRTPMQWHGSDDAGFSSAPSRRFVRPVTTGRFGARAVNVADQRRDNDSLLNWMERVIRRRRETPEIGWGEVTLLETGDRAVLAHRCDWEQSTFVAVHNFDGTPREVRVELGDRRLLEQRGIDEVVDLLDGARGVERLDDDVLVLDLAGYGMRWFRLRGPDTRNPP